MDGSMAAEALRALRALWAAKRTRTRNMDMENEGT